METTLVAFTNVLGYRLAAELAFASPGRTPLVVFSHGMGSGKASPRNRAIAWLLLERGISSFLLDYAGHGESEGTAQASTLARQVEDLGSALDFLQANYGQRLGPLGVSGSSTGGTVALFRAAQDPRLAALVLRSVRDYGVLEAARQVTIPTLVIQGGADLAVLPESRRIYEALAGPKQYLLIPGAGHLFAESPEHGRVMSEATVSWFVRYLVPVAAA